jgi:kynureninase
MDSEFVPAIGAAGWQVSNPSLVSLASLRASLELFLEAGMGRLRTKSMLLTGYLEQLLVARCEDRITILTPSDPNERGAQLSVRVVHDARRIFEGLLAQGVVCDWREPGVVRMAPVPFYNTFCEVFDASRIFSSLIDRTA